MPLTEAQKRKIIEDAVKKAEAEDSDRAKAHAAYTAARSRIPGWYWADFSNCGYGPAGIWRYSPPDCDFDDLGNRDHYGSWSHPGCEYSPDTAPKWIGAFVAPPSKKEQRY